MIQSKQTGQRPPEYLQADEFSTSGPVGWWYRLFAPAPPQGRLATLQERESIRRGRLASIILGVQLVGIELPVIPVVSSAPNHSVVLPWLFGCIAALLCAFYFNRRGKLMIAGILMVASIEVTVIVKIVTIPGGMSIFYLPQFDILIQPILIAVALLAPWSAFVVAAFNILFIIYALTFGQHAPDLVRALHTPTQVGDLFAVPIMAQILTSFFGWIIVRNLLDTIKREARAEQVASLEHTLAENRRNAEERNLQLEMGVAAIIKTIQEVSAGHARARISLPQGHALWPITTQLNRFLDRYQKVRDSDASLALTNQAIDELANEIHQASQEQRTLNLIRRQTHLDAVIMALLSVRGQGGSAEKSVKEDNHSWQRR